MFGTWKAFALLYWCLNAPSDEGDSERPRNSEVSSIHLCKEPEMLLLGAGDVCRSREEALLSAVSSLLANGLYARSSLIGRADVSSMC